MTFAVDWALNNNYPYLSIYHQNDFHIKMGSDVSHFNVSLIVQAGQSHETVVSINHNFWRERSAEAGSRTCVLSLVPAERLTTRPSRLTLHNLTWFQCPDFTCRVCDEFRQVRTAVVTQGSFAREQVWRCLFKLPDNLELILRVSAAHTHTHTHTVHDL